MSDAPFVKKYRGEGVKIRDGTLDMKLEGKILDLLSNGR